MNILINKIFLLFLLFAVGCNSENNSKNSATPANVDSSSVNENGDAVTADFSGCYASNLKKDSALLKLNISGTKVTGELSYHLFEKDNNSGIITGSVRDNLIVADYTYTFQSEGITSVRQVVFKRNNDTLVEGFGDTMMHGDTAGFKNLSGLQFQNDRPFLKTICR